MIDATAIDAPDDSYDLVVFALAFHHLPPAIACRAIAEATRVGKRFLVIDLKRRTPLATLMFPVMALPVNLALLPWSWIPPSVHDGFISALRAYSTSALGPSATPPARGYGSTSCRRRGVLGCRRTPLCSRVRTDPPTMSNETDLVGIMQPSSRVRSLRRALDVVTERLQPVLDLSRPYVDGLENLPPDGRFLLVGNHTQFGSEVFLIPDMVRRSVGTRVRPLADRNFGRLRGCPPI